jgi:hypothetical protein
MEMKLSMSSSKHYMLPRKRGVGGEVETQQEGEGGAETTSNLTITIDTLTNKKHCTVAVTSERNTNSSDNNNNNKKRSTTFTLVAATPRRPKNLPSWL